MAETCKRPGCSGKLVDGICEDCGRPPAGQTLLGKSGTINSKRVADAAAAGTSGRSASASSSSYSSSSASASGRTGSGRGSGRSGRVSTRRTLGAGLITLPDLPSMDPMLAIMADPSVPERKRFCSACNAKLSHEKGFCPMCGHEYSFYPTLKAGDVVHGQYEVKGAIAYGGLGWIYLGWDKTLSRWVVLKGLLNSKDEASAAAALAERQFLAAVKHPKIVGIYNFVTEGTEGYIVMEYVGGKTLKAIRQERGPLPPAEAIAYIHAILPAFAYLERQGLVFCDFKPDNVMLEGDDVKLIDMGGVRRADDTQGDIYGTKGYSAPEATREPSFTSDLYTIARTLAILIMDFKFQGTYEFTLPTPAEQPLFARYESLYRFLLKATHQDPAMRFQTAEEMGDQLIGILREIVAETAPTRPLESTLFGGDALTHLDNTEGNINEIEAYLQLPALKIDPTDPAANMILAASGATDAARKSTYEQAVKLYPDSSEALLRLADSQIDAGNFTEADVALAHAHELDSYDWRIAWYRGKSLLKQHQWREANACFNQLLNELPGELAPKLAVALTAEKLEDTGRATALFDLVSRTEPGFVAAAFGLARCKQRAEDRAGIVNACDRIPAASSLYTAARMTLARALMQQSPTPPGEQELIRASEVIMGLTIEGLTLHRLSADLLLTAIDQLSASKLAANPATTLLNQPLELRALKLGAERELRACAHHAKTLEERIALVDHANKVRPLTLI
jgi:serine/threonine-protein kinase PknG